MEAEDGIESVEDGGVVGDEEEGGLVALAELEEDVEDSGAGFVVEVAGWFVGEEEWRGADEGAGDGDALLFAAGQLRGEVGEALA